MYFISSLYQNKKIYLYIFAAFLSIKIFAQPIYPQGYFENPLGIPIQLAADFGELRPNHFHMGLDIRTQGKENLPVYASAEGYISRIKIEKFGFGRAIYITHPNGYVSLYAHLNNFFTQLNEYVIKKQYKDESWEQDFNLPPDLFPVDRKQFIAYSGNTGGSQGPHLHFEIRDEKTGNNINPELFGLVQDNVAPTIFGLYWYNRQQSSYLSDATNLPLKKISSQIFTLADTFSTGLNSISFGIKAEDKNTPSSYFYGIYRGTIWMDDSLLNNFELENFSYADSRYVNACMDYKKYITSKTGIQHLSVLPGNKLQIFSKTVSDGVVNLNDTMPHKITIEVADRTGNASCIYFILKYDSTLSTNISYLGFTKQYNPNEAHTLESANSKIVFSKNAFYDNVPFSLTELPMKGGQEVSNTILIHDYTVPVHDYYTAMIKTWLLPGDALRNKAVIQLSSGEDEDVEACTWKGDYCIAKFRKLGIARVLVDTVPPEISLIDLKDSAILKIQKGISVKCTDDVSNTKNFRGILDGKWILFVKKQNTCTYTFDEYCPSGKHCLQLFAEDEAGNKTEKDFVFIKK